MGLKMAKEKGKGAGCYKIPDKNAPAAAAKKPAAKKAKKPAAKKAAKKAPRQRQRQKQQSQRLKRPRSLLLRLRKPLRKLSRVSLQSVSYFDRVQSAVASNQ